MKQEPGLPSINVHPVHMGLSVVIGTYEVGKNAVECIASILQQNGETEIFLVYQTPSGDLESIRQYYPAVHLLHSPDLSAMPELWERGLRQCQRNIVATLTADCIPDAGWVGKILGAHERGFAGVGGAIECDSGSNITGWAVYFCRYSRYMLPFKEGETHDFAADNGSYKKNEIDQCSHSRTHGFWEPQIHTELIRKGLRLVIIPDIVVYFRNSLSIPAFARQRLQHGRQYGKDRGKELPFPVLMFYIIRSPLIPAVLFLRITREVMTRRKNIGHFICALPLLFLFLLGWSFGEVSGYLSSRRR